MTPEPRFSGLVLDHQGLEELELKNHPKTAVFDQNWLFLRGGSETCFYPVYCSFCFYNFILLNAVLFQITKACFHPDYQ